uniref:Crinkler family protein n=2 Tax=Rhizophagus irregularis TaxID=588596 RepID=U9UFC8_RHIID
MMLTLGPLMTESNSEYYVQTFLLGTVTELPRALETIINECFKKETFFLDVKNNNFTLFDDVFQVVINSLANQYKLDKFIKNNCNISYKLLYYSIRAIPVDLDTVISKKLKVLTVKDLMRDGWLNIVPDTTHKMLQPDSKMVWDTLEKFVANYKIFRNNLFAKLKKYKKGISLKEFYHGAVSKDLVLEIKMGLKKLDLLMDLNGFVILNGHSAPFADIFLLRKTIPESRNLLIAFQQKWYTTSQEFTIDDAVIECNKNKNAYKDVEDYDLRKFLKESCIVTVIFTSRPFKGNPNDLPDDCLIIAKRNFSQYFGLLFALQLSFDIVNHLNINSLEPKQIAERIDGIGDKVGCCN